VYFDDVATVITAAPAAACLQQATWTRLAAAAEAGWLVPICIFKFAAVTAAAGPQSEVLKHRQGLKGPHFMLALRLELLIAVAVVGNISGTVPICRNLTAEQRFEFMGRQGGEPAFSGSPLAPKAPLVLKMCLT
jgi:hypothetical protein